MARILTALPLAALPFVATAGEGETDPAATGELVVDLGRQGSFALAFSPDGRVIASVNTDNTVSFWDTSSGRLIRTVEGTGEWVRDVVFTPEGRRFVVAGGPL